jgi:hypothetical protein
VLKNQKKEKASVQVMKAQIIVISFRCFGDLLTKKGEICVYILRQKDVQAILCHLGVSAHVTHRVSWVCLHRLILFALLLVSRDLLLSSLGVSTVHAYSQGELGTVRRISEVFAKNARGGDCCCKLPVLLPVLTDPVDTGLRQFP